MWRPSSGLPTFCPGGAKRSEELAQAVGAHPRTLYRVLRALASLGIFVEEPDRHFRLTPMADLVRSEVPASLRPFAVLSGEEWVWRAEGALLAGIVQRYPQARGILFDLPAVVESAQSLLDAAGIVDRCTRVAGDFFQTLPGGGDLYMYKRVIHD